MNWIKIKDRTPTEFPVWLQIDPEKLPYIQHRKGVVLCLSSEKFLVFLAGAIAWRPARDDVPEPPREETQYDKDAAALLAYASDNNINPLFTHRTFWHAALRYDRGEVDLLLPNEHAELYDKGTLVSIIEAIRARCGGGHGK